MTREKTECHRISRCESEIVGHRAEDVPVVPAGQRAVVLGLRELRIDLQRHVEVGHRAVIIAAREQRQSAIVVRVLVVGIDLERPVVVLDGPMTQLLLPRLLPLRLLIL